MHSYPDFNRSIHQAAQTYTGLGFSVLPCHPGSKIAAVPWKAFQNRRADDAQLSLWFAQDNDFNLGIITGKISKLIVVDIDKASIYVVFQRVFPHLIDTRTVKSPKGWHLYFTIPDNLLVPSHKGLGIDLQAEGSYVIAPPSIVDGKGYELEKGGAPLAITPDDLKRLSGFFARFGSATVKATSNEEKPRKTALSPTTELYPPRPRTRLSLSGLRHHYERKIDELGGRNNALFHTACLGRDLGYTLSQVKQALIDAHVQEPPHGDHNRETEASRRREAQLTIASAFTRSPRPLRDPSPVVQLPNVVREWLLKHGLMCVLRVLEALRLLGIEPDDVFSRQDALELLDGIVGRDTVYAAFNAEVNGVKVLPEPPPSPPHDVANFNIADASQNLRFDGATKSGIALFTMPSNAELCRRLGIQAGYVSDPLTLEDIKSVKTVRQALNNRFIERRPGHYSRELLAKRLNVSVRSTQRYTKADPNVRVTPVFTAQVVTWGNYTSLVPPDEFAEDADFGPYFLVDQKNRRYPANHMMVRILLGQKKRLHLYKQQPNHYRYETPEFSREAEQQPQQTEEQPEAQSLPAWYTRIEPIIEYIQPPVVRFTLDDATTQKPLPGMNMPTKSPKGAGEAPEAKQPTETGKRKLKHEDDEHLAQHVKKTINAMTKRREDKMNIRSARLMVIRYGMKEVKWALKRVQSRKNVYKPVGLLSTILRSESKGR